MVRNTDKPLSLTTENQWSLYLLVPEIWSSSVPRSRLCSEGSSLRRWKAEVAGTNEREVKANGKKRKKMSITLKSHCSCFRYRLVLYFPVPFCISSAVAVFIRNQSSLPPNHLSRLIFSLTSQQMWKELFLFSCGNCIWSAERFLCVLLNITLLPSSLKPVQIMPLTGLWANSFFAFHLICPHLAGLWYV